MNINNLCYRVNEPDVTAEIFEDEVIAINLANGRYHSLRGAAAWLWQALAAGLGSRDAIDQLLKADDAPPDAADQAAAVIEQLTAEELIVPAPEQTAEHPADGLAGCTPVMGVIVWGVSPLCEIGSLKEISRPSDHSDWQSTR